jgi:AcrR family transcriptional regulator
MTEQVTDTAVRRRRPATVRREELIQVAREAFIADGFGGASMRQIATAAGVNQALLYQHFASKEDLFEVAVIEPLGGLVLDLLAEGDLIPGAEVEDKAAHVEHGIEALLRAMADAAPLLATLFFSGQERGRQLYIDRVQPMIAGVAEAATADLGDWGDADRDLSVLVPAVFSMCFGLAMESNFRGVPLDVAVVAPQVSTFVLHGIGAPKARPRRRRR